MIGLGLEGYDPDSQYDAAVAFRIQVVAEEHLPQPLLQQMVAQPLEVPLLEEQEKFHLHLYLTVEFVHRISLHIYSMVTPTTQTM